MLSIGATFFTLVSVGALMMASANANIFVILMLDCSCFYLNSCPLFLTISYSHKIFIGGNVQCCIRRDESKYYGNDTAYFHLSHHGERFQSTGNLRLARQANGTISPILSPQNPPNSRQPSKLKLMNEYQNAANAANVK